MIQLFVQSVSLKSVFVCRRGGYREPDEPQSVRAEEPPPPHPQRERVWSGTQRSVRRSANQILLFCLFCFPDVVVTAFTVRELDAGVSPAISIHHLGNVGATKSERAGISKLKSDMKMVD